MLFNSYTFIFLFLPVTFVGMFWVGRYNQLLAAMWLVLASFTFYAVWDPRFVLLLLGSIIFNYVAGCRIGLRRTVAPKQAKYSVIVAIAANLLLLGYFKYTNFFITSVNSIFPGHLPSLGIILPLGISFFTFTQIAFLVDVYKGKVSEYNLVHYLLFVTWFPHLIAGPVLHHKQMMPQFDDPATYRIKVENINVGLNIFIIGLAKKVMLADQFVLYANPVFEIVAQGGHPKLLEAWVGALAYTLQLYFDFSGYSDMAIGLSRMFNVKLPLNFDSPYKSPNIIEFWRRWHMTLSTFLRDYLYFPLGGNRKGRFRRYINLMSTMLLGGLWHGAGWTYVVWGGLHGLFLTINHGWRRLVGDQGPSTGGGGGGGIVGVTLTFIAVVVSWVPFRAVDLPSALRLWAGMFGIYGVSLPHSLGPTFAAVIGNMSSFEGIFPLTSLSAASLLWLIFGLFIVWFLPNTQQWMANFYPAWDAVSTRSNFSWQPTRLNASVMAVILLIALLNLGRASEFIYFQF